MRNMRRITRTRRTIGTSRHKLKPLVKGVRGLTPLVIKSIDNELDDNVKLTCMSNIREIAQRAIREKGLTNKQIRMSLGMKKFEK